MLDAELIVEAVELLRVSVLTANCADDVPSWLKLNKGLVPGDGSVVDSFLVLVDPLIRALVDPE